MKLHKLNQLIVFEISQNLSLKDKIKLSGVCKELHRKIHYKNASGKYICLRTDGIEEILFENIRKTIYDQNNLHAMQILIKSAVDINFKNKYGTAALFLASAYGKNKIIELLLENGADANLQDGDGCTALMQASIFDKNKTVELLLEYGADTNLQNKDGCTALILASENGTTEAAKLLLEYGADTNLQNNIGNTALILACKIGTTEVVKLILEQKDLASNLGENVVDVNFQNKDGYTALHWACVSGYAPNVKMLLEHRAKPNLHNRMGNAAMSMAICYQHSEIVKLLEIYKET